MSAPVRIRTVEHVGVMVIDIDSAVDWYTRNLGLEVLDRWDDADARMSWAHLQAGDFRLEFVQRPGLTVSDAPSAGIHHLAVVVDDCQDSADRLIAAGATSVFAPSYFERHHMDWSFVRDPFGNILELVAYRTAPRSPVDPTTLHEGSQG